jgi:outer membrane protein TolC
VRFIGSGGDWEAFSDLSFSITQPLIRGVGGRIVREPLTQAERSLVYEVRAFERFRRTLSVDIAERVYGVLQQGQFIVNQQQNTENLTTLRRRNEALAEAGRLSDIQADQASQDELRSANRLLLEQVSMQRLLDNFRFFLGLPITSPITFDKTTFDDLKEAGVEPITYTEEQVVAVAMRYRLDYQTTLDQVDDAIRRVGVSAEGLKTGLDVSGSVLATSDPEDPFRYDFDGLAWQLGLELDLPINRLPERNTYRRSLLTLQTAVRNAEQQADQIRVQLRDDLRRVQVTLESYEIQVAAEELAGRRVESSRLSLEAGRATTRDILEAQADLLDAQNATVTALVDHTLAKLALFTDMDILRVDEGGIWIDYTALEPPAEAEPEVEPDAEPEPEA